MLISSFFIANCQTTMYITANGLTKSISLVENEATKELVSMLEKGSITLSMTENGGFEKVGNLPQSLTTSDARQTAQTGDIMLYLGNIICIFYGSNTWAYTKLGSLNDMSSSEIKDFLSGNPVEVTLSIENEASIKEIKSSKITNEKVYNLKGQIVKERPLSSGMYIIDGQKMAVK